MAQNGMISIGFKVEAGKDGLHSLIVDAQGLSKALEATVSEAKALKDRFINFAALSTGIDSISGTLSSIQSGIKEYTTAYRTQIQAEEQLAQVMRNTMDAREEDVQSIKDFCSAQQQIGIIGDEVQLAGAQELATYLSLKGSLQSLIPVMNDMLAQQYGYSASAENASQIAMMLGKVMEGQTGALTRYGYKFDEAQEKILKYGTESERVAVLAEVVGASVGGMNEKLAQTPTGQMKQLENALGDIKEQVGEFALAYEPFVSMASGVTIAVSGVLKLGVGAATACKTVLSLKTVTMATDKVMRLLGVSSRAAALSIKGLLISSGVGIAIWALTEAVNAFVGASDKAADSADRLTSAEERLKRSEEMARELTEAEADAYRNAASSIEVYKAKLESFNGTKEEEGKLVGELNSTYGDTMGYFSSVAEWYKALVANSKAYCDQMVAEAKTRKMASQIAELEMKRDSVLRDEHGNARRYSTRREVEKVRREDKDIYGNTIYLIDEVVGKSDLDKATEEVADYNAQIAALKGNMRSAAKVAATALPVIGGKVNPNAPGKGDSGKGKGKKGTSSPHKEAAPEGSIQYYRDRISDIDKKVRFSVDPDEVYRLETEKLALQNKIKELEIPIKIASTKKEWDKMIGEIPPVSIAVEVDADSLTKELAALPKGVETSRDLDKTLSAVGQTVGTVGNAFSSMGQAFEMPVLDVMGILAGAIATMVQGYASASAQAGALGPFGWIGFAATGLATLATMVSQVKGMSKFADGGVVYGPTLGLVGEYAGARSNPEVIAPLSKLKDIIGAEPGGAVIVGGELRAKGRDLVAVIENQTKVAGTSGRRFRT